MKLASQASQPASSQPASQQPAATCLGERGRAEGRTWPIPPRLTKFEVSRRPHIVTSATTTALRGRMKDAGMPLVGELLAADYALDRCAVACPGCVSRAVSTLAAAKI